MMSIRVSKNVAPGCHAFRDQKFTGWAKESTCQEVVSAKKFQHVDGSTCSNQHMKQRVHKIFEAQYYYKLCVDCEWDTINAYATTNVRQPLCSSKLKSPEWKAVKRCVNFVSRMLQPDAIGNSSKDDIILYDDMQFVFKNPSCFFFSGAVASLQFHSSTTSTTYFDSFDGPILWILPWFYHGFLDRPFLLVRRKWMVHYIPQ